MAVKYILYGSKLSDAYPFGDVLNTIYNYEIEYVEGGKNYFNYENYSFCLIMNGNEKFSVTNLLRSKNNQFPFSFNFENPFDYISVTDPSTGLSSLKKVYNTNEFKNINYYYTVFIINDTLNTKEFFQCEVFLNNLENSTVVISDYDGVAFLADADIDITCNVLRSNLYIETEFYNEISVAEIGETLEFLLTENTSDYASCYIAYGNYDATQIPSTTVLTDVKQRENPLGRNYNIFYVDYDKPDIFSGYKYVVEYLSTLDNFKQSLVKSIVKIPLFFDYENEENYLPGSLFSFGNTVDAFPTTPFWKYYRASDVNVSLYLFISNQDQIDNIVASLLLFKFFKPKIEIGFGTEKYKLNFLKSNINPISISGSVVKISFSVKYNIIYIPDPESSFLQISGGVGEVNQTLITDEFGRLFVPKLGYSTIDTNIPAAFKKDLSSTQLGIASNILNLSIGGTVQAIGDSINLAEYQNNYDQRGTETITGASNSVPFGSGGYFLCSCYAPSQEYINMIFRSLRITGASFKTNYTNLKLSDRGLFRGTFIYLSANLISKFKKVYFNNASPRIKVGVYFIKDNFAFNYIFSKPINVTFLLTV